MFVLPRFGGLRGRTSGSLKMAKIWRIEKIASFSNWGLQLFNVTCWQIFSPKQTKKSSSVTRAFDSNGGDDVVPLSERV